MYCEQEFVLLLLKSFIFSYSDTRSQRPPAEGRVTAWRGRVTGPWSSPRPLLHPLHCLDMVSLLCISAAVYDDLKAIWSEVGWPLTCRDDGNSTPFKRLLNRRTPWLFIGSHQLALSVWADFYLQIKGKNAIFTKGNLRWIKIDHHYSAIFTADSSASVEWCGFLKCFHLFVCSPKLIFRLTVCLFVRQNDWM